MDDRLCLGVITGAHGVRGLVRIRSFTESAADIVAYGALEDADGRSYRLEIKGRSGRGALLARLDGVDDRTAAEALKGTALHVRRAALPPAGQDEFYHADLIGLPVERRDGRTLGTVRALQNFGAGDLLDVELAGSGQSALLPFDRDTVPVVDLAAGRLVVDPIPGLIDGDDGTADSGPRRQARQ